MLEVTSAVSQGLSVEEGWSVLFVLLSLTICFEGGRNSTGHVSHCQLWGEEMDTRADRWRLAKQYTQRHGGLVD